MNIKCAFKLYSTLYISGLEVSCARNREHYYNMLIYKIMDIQKKFVLQKKVEQVKDE